MDDPLDHGIDEILTSVPADFIYVVKSPDNLINL